MWKITFFSEKIADELEELPRQFQGKITALADRMRELGPNIGMPYTKYIRNGLCEMRLSEEIGIARVFYCAVVNQEIVILHSFVKKTQEIPKRELELALKRMKEVKDGKKSRFIREI